MRRPQSLENLRKVPNFEPQEQPFKTLSHEKRLLFTPIPAKPPNLQYMLNEIDDFMKKYEHKSKIPLKVRSPLLDLNLYTLADVNIPEENPQNSSNFALQESKENKELTITTNTKASFSNSKRSEELFAEKKVKEIEKLMVENAKCLNEKIALCVAKQSKEFRNERENFINHLMKFTTCFYQGLEEKNVIELEKIKQKLKGIRMGQLAHCVEFLKENAKFLLQEKIENLKKTL